MGGVPETNPPTPGTRPPPKAHGTRKEVISHPPPTTKAGGTHPTGMLPCFVIVNTNFCIQFRTMVKSMRTKNPSHNAFKFEVGEENRIVHESLY